MRKFPVYMLFLFGVCKAQSVSFVQALGSPMTYTNAQRGYVSKDLNGDGIKDFIVGNRSGLKVLKIYLGTGNGQFSSTAASSFTLSGSAISSTVDDFNNDGKPDIASANWGTGGYVSILLGNGTGSFTNAIGSPVFIGGFPISLKSIDAADFNTDGNKDLVVSDENQSKVYILLGNGSGGFTGSISTSVAVGSQPGGIKTGLFNSDAFPDFVVANGTGNSISVFLGTGTGSFTQAPNSPYSVGTWPQNIAAGNFNNDTFPDLVVNSSSTNSLSIFLGSANGVFTPAPGSPVNVGNAGFQSVIADFNLDGSMDIATSHVNKISFLLGSGIGTFTYVAHLFTAMPGAAGIEPIVTEDFNGDNKPDLATGEWSPYERIFVFLNTSTGCAVNPVFSYTAGANGLVNFTSRSTGTIASTTFSWSFGDGNSASGMSPSHTYSTNGIYVATLTVTNYTPPCVLSYTTFVNVNTITGIGPSESNPENYFSVLPNPTSGMIEIKTTYSKAGTGIIIYNALGAEELRFELAPGPVNTIDISPLKNGVYYYQLVRKEERIKSGKIVLEK
ncbi:MAG: FG-GAP-like repeat-containing protein [Bacteroidota bacterium]